MESRKYVSLAWKERFWTGPKWMGTYPLFQSNNSSWMLLCALRLQHRTEVANWQPVAESDVFCPSLLYLHYLPGPPRFLSFQPLVFAVTKTGLQINNAERESTLWVEWGRAQVSGWRGAEWELYLGFCTWLLGWALGGKFCVCILWLRLLGYEPSFWTLSLVNLWASNHL